MNRLQLLLLSSFSGALLGFGWPEMGNITPFLFVGFIPLLIVQEEAQKQNRKIMGYAYIAFFFWNLIVSWWVYCVSEGLVTKLVSIGAPVLINPLFMAIVFWAFHKTKKLIGEKQGYLGLIVYWIAFEYLHMNWSLSYPWLTLGNGFANTIPIVQWYEFTGVFGGSFWILLVNILLYKVLRQYLSDRVFAAWLTPLLVLLIPIGVSLFIHFSFEEKENPVEVVVLQPNIDPYNEKFNGLTPDQQVDKMLTMAKNSLTPNTKYIVGPETSIPGSLWENKLEQYPTIRKLRNLTDSFPQTEIITGLSLNKIYQIGEKLPPTVRPYGNIQPQQWYDHFNAAIQIAHEKPVETYYKSKLVLGVETMPFPALFKKFQDLVFDLGGTTGSLGTQEEREVFQSKDGKLAVAPVICWESVYGEYCGEYVQNGANLIFIMTNDGWWDDTPGYDQHKAYARLRAIETRRSIARSANTGTSCFINQRGDVLQPTNWWEEAVIVGKINANDRLTFYVRMGDYIARLSAFVAALLLLWTLVRRFSKKELSYK